MTKILVDVDWLRGHVETRPEADLRVVDVRWVLGNKGAGRAAYEAGHVPGAAFVDVDGDLAAPAGPGGRHPLPDPSDFARALGRAGVTPSTHVVAYDDMGGAIAARLWWMLRAIGHERVSILDGGFPAWVASGAPVDAHAPKDAMAPAPMPAPSVAAEAVHAWRLPRSADPADWGAVSRAEVERISASGGPPLLDARAPERYRGDVEPIDPRKGHIPGAVNAPFAKNLADGKFLPPEALRAIYAPLGEGEVVAYCGSGVTACHDVVARALAGLGPTRLYAGGWSEWSRSPSLPVATGDGA